MRVAVIAVLIGLVSAQANPLDLQATADVSANGVDYTPLEHPLVMRVTQAAGELRLSTSVTKLFDANAYEALNNLATTIHVHVIVQRANSGDPIEVRRIVRTVRYDQWDERYRIDGDGGPHVLKMKADALVVLTTLDNVAIARLADLPHEPLSIAVVAELNPITEHARAEVAGWLSGSMFGRVVSAFVEAGPDGADRVLRARTPAFRL
jgi:hypothetical protein